MPLAHIQLGNCIGVTPQKMSDAAAAASQILSQAIGKPIVYCMATVNEVVGCFAGQPGPCAFVMIKSIGGLNGRVNNVLCAKFCEMLATKFGIAGERIYLNFQDVPASSWGHDGATFG